jgi:hypothetical protein
VRAGTLLPPRERIDVDRVTDAAVSELGREAFTEALERGRRLCLEEAAGYALGRRSLGSPQRHQGQEEPCCSRPAGGRWWRCAVGRPSASACTGDDVAHLVGVKGPHRLGAHIADRGHL